MADFVNEVKFNMVGLEGLTRAQQTIKGVANDTRVAESVARSFANALNSINAGNLKAIDSHFKSLERTITKTASETKNVKFDGMKSGLSTIKSIDSTLKQLLKTVQEIKSNSNVTINVTANTAQAQSQLNTLYSSTGKRHSQYNVGNSNNGANIYGFNADTSLAYQSAKPILQVGRGIQRMGEKVGLVGANLMMASSFLGTEKLSKTIVETPAKAEVQKYLLTNMQGGATIQQEGGGGTTSLYKTLDQTTDRLPISMQNVVQPLYAFKAASGATAQQINDIIPEFANFGAQVINMTGSQEQAEEAMQKLSRAYQGQYAAVDQYGITKESLEKVGYHEGGSIEEFMDAVTKITGNAEESMNNFNGMKALVGKDFSRAGKRIWQEGFGQVMSGLVGTFHGIDKATGGFSTELLVAGGALFDFSTKAATIIGALGTTVGTFGQLKDNLAAVRKGGGLRAALKNIRGGGMVDPTTGMVMGGGLAGGIGETAAIESAVYEGAFAGTSAGMGTANANSMLGKNGKVGAKDDAATAAAKAKAEKEYVKARTKAQLPPVYSTKFKGTGGRADPNFKYGRNVKVNSKQTPVFRGIDNSMRNKQLTDKFLASKDYTSKMGQKRIQHNLEANASRMFDSWENAEKTISRNATKMRKFNEMGRPHNYSSFRDVGHKVSWKLRSPFYKGTTLLNKHVPSIGQGFSKLGGILGGLISPTGAIVGLGMGALLAKGALDSAAAHSDKAKDARTNLERSFGNIGNRLSQITGNFFRDIGLTNSGGEEGLYDGITRIANDVARIANRITGHTPDEEEYKNKQKEDMEDPYQGKKSEAEKDWSGADYHYDEKEKKYVPDTPFDKKQAKAMSDQKWMGNFYLGAAQALDWVGDRLGHKFGATEFVEQNNALEEGKIKSGNIDTINTHQGNSVIDSFMNPIEYRLGVQNPQLLSTELTSPLATGAQRLAQLLQNSDFSGIWKESSDTTTNTSGSGATNTKQNQTQDVNATNVELNASTVDAGKEFGKDPISQSALHTMLPLFPSALPLELFSMLPTGAAADPNAEQRALAQARNNVTPGQTPVTPAQPNAQPTNAQNQTPQVDTTALTTGIQTDISSMDLGTPLNTAFTNASATIDLSSIASNFSNGFNEAMSGISLDFSGITSQLNSKAGEFNSAGNTGGSNYQSGFSSGVSGTSGIAQGEADAVVAALRTSIEGAAEAGAAAGRAYKENYEAESDIGSPGIAARLALGEAMNLVKGLMQGVWGAGKAGRDTAASYTKAIDDNIGFGGTTTDFSYNAGYGDALSKTINDTSGLNIQLNKTPENKTVPPETTPNKNINPQSPVTITNNFNIERIDSKDRVKEIAEAVKHVLTFNNETAGRNTNVGL